MRLSQLLKLKQDLQKHNNTKLEDAVNDAIAHVNQLAMSPTRLSEADTFQTLNAEYRNILPQLRKIDELKQSKIQDLDVKISEWDKQYFIDSYEMYESQHKLADVATHRDIRKLYTYENIKDIVKTRIYSYVDWRYPTLEIGPGDGEFTQYLTAGDPLYIVDIHQEFIDSTKKQFNEFYSTRRLRPYLINNDYDLSMLPQKQMAFVLAWNIFNYFPLEAIKDYIKEIVKVMRPGGVLMFSYNNSDRWQGAEMVENAFMCHTPKHVLLPLVESLGLEVIASKDYDPTVSWVEVRKPGVATTCKAHQSMGAVIQILDPDEDPKSIEARAQEELRVSLDAQTRFEIQRNRPDLLETAVEYKRVHNTTLEKALDIIFEQEGLDLSEVHNYKNHILMAQENMTAESIEQAREENLRLAKKARSNND